MSVTESDLANVHAWQAKAQARLEDHRRAYDADRQEKTVRAFLCAYAYPHSQEAQEAEAVARIWLSETHWDRDRQALAGLQNARWDDSIEMLLARI